MRRHRHDLFGFFLLVCLAERTLPLKQSLCYERCFFRVLNPGSAAIMPTLS
jgi:hypothetical protein